MYSFSLDDTNEGCPNFFTSSSFFLSFHFWYQKDCNLDLKGHWPFQKLYNFFTSLSRIGTPTTTTELISMGPGHFKSSISLSYSLNILFRPIWLDLHPALHVENVQAHAGLFCFQIPFFRNDYKIIILFLFYFLFL